MKLCTHGPRTLLALAALGVASCTDHPTEPSFDIPEASYSIDPTSPVRINEIHYDNAGGDVDEAVEIQAAAGFDLEGWTLVRYNGSSSVLAPYGTEPLSGLVPDICGGTGVVTVTYPANGLQNGSPDGLALVDETGTVREFLSWEGTFTAASGPAAGLTSTDIGVEEGSSTPPGESLQRADDGTWFGPAAATFGACNDGSGGGGGGGGGGSSTLFLSELHYDNAGSDANEGVEVSGPAGSALDGWSVVFYNGSGGAVYGTLDLTGTIPETCRPEGGLAFERSGIQNGAPDGLALVDPEGAVVEFLSYDGVFTASDGPAAGLTSTDMGVAEGSSTGADESLQRASAEAPWTGPGASTFGCTSEPGGGGGPTGPVYLSEIRADQPGSDPDEYVELGGAPGTGLDGVSLVVVSDGAGGFGVVENVTDFGGRVLDAAGAFVAAEASFTLGTADLVTSLNFENGDNPTFFLVRDFTGANGQDLDIDDDGTLESEPWAEVLDCLSLIEFLGLGPIYCDARLGGDVSFTPGHSVRGAEGWFSANFTPGSGDTPGQLQFDPATAVAGQIAPWGVGEPGEPTSVSVSAGFVPLPVGFNRALFATVRDDFRNEVEGAELTFTSSNPGVVVSDGFGNLTASGVGSATLTVGVVGLDIAAEVTVEVEPDVASGVAFQDHTEFGVPTDRRDFDDIVVRRDEYVVSYNPKRAAANWVSWNLDADHIGDVERCECYTPDPLLPGSAPAVVNFDFTGSGYSRGHMTQSFNRTVTLPDNAATYYTTNILPQAAANNGGPWGDFEFYTNGRAFDGEEVYLVAGGEFGRHPSTLKGEGKVQIPDWTWKVAVFLGPDETLDDVESLDDLEVIAIRTPNRIEPGVDGTTDGISDRWEDYVVEVDEIEARTGYDLLDLLDDGLEVRLESGFDVLESTFDAQVEAGALRRGAQAALGAQLRGTVRKLERGWTRLAILQLGVFKGLLRVFERAGGITAEAAAVLDAEAAAVLEVLRI